MAGKNSKGGEKRGPATIQNRRASYDYHFEETVEAGIVLVGSEVKSLFLGHANLTDAYCQVKDNELWIFNLDIEPYKYATSYSPDRKRDRKLLMHRREIDGLRRKSEQKGYSLIPYKIYFSNGKAKVGIALARGKKLYDKRDSLKEKAERRDLRRMGDD
ncbi:SsrA-binding protein SmpB [Kamptonema cortianum]|nr:SsrA-binding protein SmpB [Geitlerinema splendidum]MDK3158506.1 SsrA-binding protein SmpB [Kamptonema cortianum]